MAFDLGWADPFYPAPDCPKGGARAVITHRNGDVTAKLEFFVTVDGVVLMAQPLVAGSSQRLFTVRYNGQVDADRLKFYAEKCGHEIR